METRRLVVLFATAACCYALCGTACGATTPESKLPRILEAPHTIPDAFQLVDEQTHVELGMIVNGADKNGKFSPVHSRCTGEWNQSYKPKTVPNSSVFLDFVTTSDTMAALGATYQVLKASLKLSTSETYKLKLETTKLTVPEGQHATYNLFEHCCEIDPDNCPGTHVVSEIGELSTKLEQLSAEAGEGGVDALVVSGEATYASKKEVSTKQTFKFVRFAPLPQRSPLSANDVDVEFVNVVRVVRTSVSDPITYLKVVPRRSHVFWTVTTSDSRLHVGSEDDGGSHSTSGQCDSAPCKQTSVPVYLAQPLAESEQIALNLTIRDDHYHGPVISKEMKPVFVVDSAVDFGAQLTPTALSLPPGGQAKVKVQITSRRGTITDATIGQVTAFGGVTVSGLGPCGSACELTVERSLLDIPNGSLVLVVSRPGLGGVGVPLPLSILSVPPVRDQ